MAQRAKSKSAPRKTGSPLDVIMMLTLEPGRLKDLNLPAGVELAAVSKNETALRRLSGKLRVGQLRRLTVGGSGNASSVKRNYSGGKIAGNRKKHGSSTSAVIDERAFEPDARAQAILDGVRIAQEDLRRSGGAYDLQQMMTLMHGISRQAIDKRVQERSLIAVPGPSNRRSYPTLQFNSDGTVVEGLKQVRDALPTRNPWTILNFLAEPDDRLGGRKPIDLLKEGRVELVVEAAQRMGQQGA